MLPVSFVPLTSAAQRDRQRDGLERTGKAGHQHQRGRPAVGREVRAGSGLGQRPHHLDVGGHRGEQKGRRARKRVQAGLGRPELGDGERAREGVRVEHVLPIIAEDADTERGGRQRRPGLSPGGPRRPSGGGVLVRRLWGGDGAAAAGPATGRRAVGGGGAGRTWDERLDGRRGASSKCSARRTQPW